MFVNKEDKDSSVISEDERGEDGQETGKVSDSR